MASLQDALKAQAAATEPLPVPLGDKTVRVLPPLDWRSSATEAIGQGRFTTWAHGALHPDDVATWDEVDPTNRQVVAFFDAYKELAGQAPGESQPSQS